MEYVEGETLARRLRRGPLPYLKLSIRIQIADAWTTRRNRPRSSGSEARQRHADAGGTKLLDFGLAQWPLDADASERSH